jgi:CRP-like cAMP-binding protein
MMDDAAPIRTSIGNHLLDLLPTGDLDRLRPHLTEIGLELNQTLHEPGDAIRHVYFPVQGFISIVAEMRHGAVVEVGVAGKEGMLGLGIALGDDRSPYKGMVQMAGRALRMPAAVLRDALRDTAVLQTVLLRYAQVSFNTAMQSAACNRAHLLEQRFARWVLAAGDRVEGDRFPLTHEFLAMMLGVRRAGVTVAAQSMQSAGFIRYSHGQIAIVDREGFEGVACECYGAIKREYGRLLRADGG